MKDLIDPLRAKADGTTSVAMKTEFSRVSLQVISEVWSHPVVPHPLTPSQVAFGADFERDPFVQNLAGKDGLTPLIKTAFDGVGKAFLIPLQQVMTDNI